MIPRAHITAWRARAPWLADAQVELGRLDPKVLLACFRRYLSEEGRTVTRAQFEENLAGKRTDPDFRDDVGPLLRPGFTWDFEAAMDAVLQKLVAPLAGAPWKGAAGDVR